MNEPELIIPFRAGALVRGQVKRALTERAWRNGLNIRFEEQKGLLDSIYRAIITGGTSSQLEDFAQQVNDFMASIFDE